MHSLSALFARLLITCRRGSNVTTTTTRMGLALLACESPSHHLFLFDLGDSYHLSSYWDPNAPQATPTCTYDVRTR
jgi:hypothetical protein